MKKQLTLYISLLSTLLAYGQAEVTLSSAYTGSSVTACTRINLKPGFSYKAVSGKSVSLKVSPSTCDPFNGQEIDATKLKGENYIRTKTFLKDDASRYLDQVQYFDGLGRPIQTVQRGITPGTNDLATYQQYDDVGRESLSWLPSVVKAGNNGTIVPQATVIANAQTTYADTRPYTEPVYEASPLNRITKQYGPGKEWASAPVTTDYQTNDQTSALACILYTTGGTRQAPTLTKNSNYATGELYVTKIGDEVKNVSYEFKDKLGQVVLTRQVNDGVNYDTYYVYNDYGDLCFVLPPLAAGKSDVTTLNLYAYQYKYNDRGLCISKKLPGCNAILYVYDKADRLILSQDGEQSTSNKWGFTKYDDFGRVILTGIATLATSNTHASLQTKYKDIVVKEAPLTGGSYGYSWTTLPEAPYTTVLTANYYDDVNRMLDISADFKSKLAYVAQSGYGTNYTSSKGLLVGTRIKYTNETGNVAGEITSAMYYDQKGQVIQSKSTNHLGGTEFEYFAYNFTGQPTKKQHVHTNGTTTQTETFTYEYDHAGRLLSTRHKLNSGSEVVLAQNTYDDLGRLKSTVANNQSALTTKYTYNVRSWTNTITNTHFSQTLTYNLNGNIGTQQWTQNSKTRKYAFTYDNISRLKAANYTGDGNFSTSYLYDAHGNVKNLTRYGITASGINNEIIDNLTFNYDGMGNQLKYITDAGPDVKLSTIADFKDLSKVTTAEFTYNKNGAMTKDLNKGQTVIYNPLNLPQEMLISNISARGKTYYTYTVTGAKLRVRHLSDPTLMVQPVSGTDGDNAYTDKHFTDYAGNKIYEDGALSKILTDNGYIEGGNYYFYIKDHLGNNRIVANAAGTVVQRNSYYPFGMAYGEESDLEQGKQPYKYNGKELDKMHGLNWYDYEARFMDPASIRFTSVDPLAEKYYSISPYVYVANNPLKLIDPDGRSYTDYVDNDGVRQVKTNDATPDRIETALPEVSVVGQAIQKEGNGTVATGYVVNMNASAGGSVGANVVTVVKIEKGPDEDKVIHLTEANLGGGATLDVSGAVAIVKYNYIGDIENFNTRTFEGLSTYEDNSFGIGVVSIGVGNSTSQKDASGGVLKSRTFSIGVGAGSPINISTGITISKPHKR